MRAVIQRVSKASIVIDGKEGASMEQGLVILLGVSSEDSKTQADYLCDKIMGLRIFTDSEDKLNLSVEDVGGQVLVVSNFTLYGDCRKGRRPSFIQAGKPPLADGLYDYFVERMKANFNTPVHTGEFGGDMQITLTNDGPVTIMLDTDQMMK